MVRDDERPKEPGKGEGFVVAVQALVSGGSVFVQGADPNLTAAVAFTGAAATLLPLWLKQRSAKWYRWLSDGIEEVEGLRERMDNPSNDEPLVSTAVQATFAALRTHQEEKHVALRNAVLNAALPGAPEDEVQSLYVRFVDELSPTHLALLAFVDDPSGYAAAQRQRLPDDLDRGHTGRRQAAQALITTLEGRDHLYTLMAQDLMARGLAERVLPPPGIARLGSDLDHDPLERRSTDFGRDFLGFIGDPPTRTVELDGDQDGDGNTTV